MTWPGLTKDCKDPSKTCKTCQLYKKQQRKYCHLPAKEAEIKPWKTVCVDLKGPYAVNTPTGKITLLAMTMIDPATFWFELHQFHSISHRQPLVGYLIIIGYVDIHAKGK